MESTDLASRDTAADPGAPVPPATLEGWYVLHQLFRIDWPLLKGLDAERAARILADFGAWLETPVPRGEEGWSGAYEMVGAGGDLLLVHFRPDLDGLTRAGREVAWSDLAELLDLVHEYVSVVELGLYGLTTRVADEVNPADREAYDAALAEALDAQRELDYVKRRLYPVQPEDMPYVCYYPMDKRRTPGQNWYALGLERRAELMHAHGSVGRRYAGRIQQVISGSVGLADWEWAVTLWSADPLCFKSIITEMRYDEASAEYAEFGPFYVGKRLPPDRLGTLLPPEGR